MNHYLKCLDLSLELYFMRCIHIKNIAGSVNQAAATAFSESIFKAAHPIAIFRRKIAGVSRNNLASTHRLGGSSHLPQQVIL